MKIKLLFLLLALLGIGGSLSAQTNSARMLSGTNTIISCPYQIQAADVTKLDVFNSSASCAVSLPSPATSGFGVGTIFSVKNNGAGTVTITPTAGTIGGSSFLQLTTGQGADIYSTGAVTGDSYEAQQGAGTGGGNIYGTITNSVFTANNALAATFNVQGLPLGNGGAPVTSCPYTVQPDSLTSTLDRGTVIAVNSSGACAITLDDPSTSGMANNYPVKFRNEGTGTLTVSRQTTATFNIANGSTITAAATSFALTTGQYATVYTDNTNWRVDAVTGAGAIPATGTQGAPAVYTGASAIGSGSTYSYVSAAPSSCTVSAVTSATQMGCAFLNAKAAVTASGTDVILILPCGISNSDIEMDEPNIGAGFSTPAVSFEGCGNDGDGSHVRLTTSQNHLLYKAAGPNGSIHLKRVWFDGNGLAQQETVKLTNVCCMAGIDDVNVTGSVMAGFNSSQFNIQGGGSGGGESYEYTINKLKVFANGSAINTGTLATLSTTVSGGVPTITISSGGSNYANAVSGVLPVELVGSPAPFSTAACSDPGYYTATITGGSVTALTTVAAASGCASNTVAYVLDVPPSQFGAIFTGQSDSSVYDFVSQSMGTPVYARGTITNCAVDGSGNATLTISGAVNLFAVGEYAYVSGLSVCTAVSGHSWQVTSASSTQVVLSTTSGTVASSSDSGTIIYYDDGYGFAASGPTFWRAHPYYSMTGLRAGGGAYYDLHNDSNFNFAVNLVGSAQFFNLNSYWNTSISSFVNSKGVLLNNSFTGSNFIGTTCGNNQNSGGYIEFENASALDINGRFDRLGAGVGIWDDQPCNSSEIVFNIIGSSASQNTGWGYSTWNGKTGWLFGSTTKTATTSTSYSAPGIVFHGSSAQSGGGVIDDFYLSQSISSGQAPQVNFNLLRFSTSAGQAYFNVGSIGTNFTGINLNVYGHIAATFTANPTTDVNSPPIEWVGSHIDVSSVQQTDTYSATLLETGTTTSPNLLIQHSCSTTGTIGTCNEQFSGNIQALTFTSTQSTGTAPFTVSSTTQVANLQAATAGNLAAAAALPNGTSATTQSPGDASTDLATDAFVAASFAPIASPTLTGIPAAPTASTGTSTTQLATTAFVNNSIGAITVPGWMQYYGDASNGALSYSANTAMPSTEVFVSTFACSGTTTITPQSISIIIRATVSITIGSSCTLSTNASVAGKGDLGASGASGGGGTLASAAGNGTYGYSGGSIGVLVAGGAVSAAAGGAGNNGTNTFGGEKQSAIANGPIYPETNASCGAAGSAGGSSGGAGGGGGGCIILIAPVITLGNGTVLTAAGANGTAAPGNSTGGGGGGGGGVIIVRSPALTDNGATFTVTGGSGGGCASFTTCGAGGTGGAGWSKEISH